VRVANASTQDSKLWYAGGICAGGYGGAADSVFVCEAFRRLSESRRHGPFLDRTFGAGMFTGSLNVLLWLSYVVMLSLYAFAFGSCGATFLPLAWQGIGKHALISFAVITIAGMNLVNAELIGKAEIWIVFDLTSIATLGSAGLLLIFAAVNSANARLAPHTHSRGWISAAGAVACLLALGARVWQTGMNSPVKLWVLAAMLAMAVLIEGAFRLAKREIRLHE
jgi:amino acid transporter